MYSVYYDNNTRTKKYLILFSLFLENKDLNCEEFINKINKSLNTKYDLSDLKNIIKQIRMSHSVSKAETMNDILNYVISNNTDDKLKEKLENLDKKFFYMKKGSLCSGNINKNKELEKEKLIKDINSQMDLIISKEKSGESGLISKVKSNIKYIDFEKYIDFLETNFNIQATSKKELEQFLEVINYFITNLENNLYKLNFLNPDKNEDQIRNFHVSNEEKLSEYYTNNILRLYKWKKQTIESLLDKYNNIKETIEIIIKNNNLKEFKTLKYTELDIIKDNEEFVYNYYKDLYEMKKVYEKHVNSLYTINDKDKKTIDELFTKKLLLENDK
ncbi:MAG: hypothetical protein IJ105_03995 [Bacilli bacterium]|nr:hypothetical protein [Bacilli bacterium]